MPDFWKSMTDGFMPHGYCLRWDGPLLFVFIVGNLGIAIAYFLIPAALRYFIGKRKDLPYGYMFKLFAAFILSCGLTHIAKVVTLYQPAYWIEACLDLLTAGVSLLTAVLLFPLIPKALQLRSAKELEEANDKLQQQIAQTQKAEGAFMSMVAAVKDYGIFILSPEGTILTWNEGAQSMKGYRADEVIGKNFSIFYTEEAQKSKHPAFELQQAVQNGSYEEEGWRVRSDGSKFWASISITPIPGGGFVKVASDLTERKQNEQEIIKARDQARRDFEQSENKFAQLFDLLPQLGWTAKADGFIDFYNQEWYDFTGTTYEEMQGWGWEKVHDPLIFPKVLELWKHSLATGTAFSMEFPLRRKDGIFNAFVTRVNPVFDDGKVSRWVGINTNIQDQKDAWRAVAESEKQFRHLAAALPDIVWTLDNQLECKYINERWYLYTGRKPPDGLGQSWREIVHPECLTKALLDWEKAITNKQPYESEQRLLAADGSYRWHIVRGIPIMNEQGDITSWFGTCTDIHEKRAYSEELKRAVEQRTAELLIARDEAIAANEAKGRFLSTVSHEVRTPIAGVIGVVELIHVSAKQEDLRDLSKVALESCKRLLHILNDLLDASKLQSGAVNLENRFFSVRPVLGDVVQLANPEAAKKQLILSSAVDSNVPELVCGDELRLRQILQNLVFNAVKFTKKGTVDIRVQLIEQTHNATTLKFSVTDTGIGISEEQKNKLFQPFAQAEDSTTRIYGGTGLGLHICRTLTDLMGGDIDVTSQVGQGSTFSVRIPFRDDVCRTD